LAVVVDVEEVEVAAQGLCCAISPRTYGVFNSISIHLPRSTGHKFSKFLEIFFCTRNTYTNAAIILSRANIAI
jgi:hypothetical protein